MEEYPTKRCSCCGNYFPDKLEYFAARSKRRRDSFCRECRKKKQQAEYVPKRPHRVEVNGTIECKTCGKRFPKTREYFYIDKKSGRFFSSCIACIKSYYAEWRLKQGFIPRSERPKIFRQRVMPYISKKVRKEIYQEQNGRCAYCGCELNGRYDVDHVIPRSRGGAHERWNWVVTCQPCNRSKHNKTLEEWRGGIYLKLFPWASNFENVV